MELNGPVQQHVLSKKKAKKKKYKLEYPQIQETIEYYCPRCDMYFKTREEYQDHLMLKSFKMPFVNKLRDFHSNTMNSQYSSDFEDDRDKVQIINNTLFYYTNFRQNFTRPKNSAVTIKWPI